MAELDIDSVKEILGRALIDKTFRDELLEDPDSVIRELGYTHSTNSQAFFRSLTKDGFEGYADTLDERVGGLSPSHWH